MGVSAKAERVPSITTTIGFRKYTMRQGFGTFALE